MKRSILIPLILLGLLGLEPALLAEASHSCVFVHNGSLTESSISSFALSSDGLLTEAPGSPYLTLGTGLLSVFGTLAASDKLLVVSDSGLDPGPPSSVAVFKIAPDCALALGEGSFLTTGPMAGGVAVDEDTSQIFVSGYKEDAILRLVVGADGSIQYVDSYPLTGNTGPLDLVVDSSRRLLLVAEHTIGAIASFRVLPDGSLAEVDGSPFEQPAMFLAPMTSTSDRRLIFAIDGRNARIHALRLAKNGALRRVQGSPWRLIETAGGFSAGDLELSEKSGVIFVTNTSRKQVEAFKFSQSGKVRTPSFAITPISQGRPAGLELSADSRFMLVTIVTGSSPDCGSDCLLVLPLEGDKLKQVPVDIGHLPTGTARSVLSIPAP